MNDVTVIQKREFVCQSFRHLAEMIAKQYAEEYTIKIAHSFQDDYIEIDHSAQTITVYMR